MTWNKELRAIRSLRSEHHANNIEPRVVNINWDLGKRCNYDCSYCSPAIHDWTSPHHSVAVVKNFIGQIDAWVESQNKTFNISLTGGEPFVHPDIIDVIRIIRQANTFGDQFSITTNGSLPLELYRQSFAYLTNLTVSLHLERSNAETQATLNKAIALHHEFPNRWVTVQVMCMPGKLEFIDTVVIPLLESNGVRFTLRRIRPWLNETVDEWQAVAKRQILKTEYTLEQQTQMKEAEKLRLDSRLTQIYNSEEYYTAEELAWLRDKIPETTWQNIGIWDEDMNYREVNSDLMTSNNRNQFPGWTCFAGVDSLFIDFDGLLYRGVCHNDGPIGHISKQIDFSNTPTICKKQWCTSNVDQTVRKARPEFLHLITNPTP
jgi:MoaA/NifB/PqqE/SkfB family radical SAM enzyme